ncbi:MerR family transcriptional regulator [Danxiaibacter flavus]|uniref:MerR family transcriptional regulator n=1 Tax=Danxiaibacter flavus TaxID=3049108 RepID=A0ABV3ZLR2_9BACT|nr:MerR family transcriptional regulator [Chitinophagaceae bacterium DXS]
MNVFTIKDLENLSGIKAHTIRIWEQRYSFLKPQRTNSNIRYYSSEELKMLLNIALLNKYGYKISHINKLSTDEIKGKVLSIAQMQAGNEQIVNELIHHMVEMDANKFEAVLNNTIETKGIENTISGLIFPYLERTGVLWATNNINPAQEHLATNIIRQKLLVGIDCVECEAPVNKTVALFLPQGEYHEIGLLFMHYMLKRRGLDVLYLGVDTSLDDLGFVTALRKPDFLYTHLTSVATSFNFEKFINAAVLQAAGKPVIISGQIIKNYNKKLPPTIFLKNSLQDVIFFMANPEVYG